MTFIEEVRPLLDDWASEIEVTIDFFHEWSTKDSRRLTAVGHTKSGDTEVNTVIVPFGFS